MTSLDNGDELLLAVLADADEDECAQPILFEADPEVGTSEQAFRWRRKLEFTSCALEAISQMPQEDADASELDEAEEVLLVALPARDQAAVVLIATKLPTILRPPLPVRAIRRDHFDAALFPETLIEAIAVVGLVSDQSIGGHGEEPGVESCIDECDLSWRSTRNPCGDRKTRAVCNRHDLGPLPTLGLSDGRAPFLAPAKVPSMKASVMSIPPR
jgi:hypothetical protein